MKRTTRYLLFIVAIVYIGACVYLYVFQRTLMYHPVAHYAPPPASLAMDEVTLSTSDGLSLTAWFHPPQDNEKTVIYFHGNKDGLTKRATFYQQLIDTHYGVLAVDYRGFSLSDGSPSETGLFRDADAAIAFLRNQGVIDANVILLGRSLGTGVATYAATTGKFAGLVLISPYSSITNVAMERYPIFPVKWLLQDHFDSRARAQFVDEPVFIFHGTDDRIIPVHHAHELYDAFSAPRNIKIYDGARHHNLPFDDIIAEMSVLQ